MIAKLVQAVALGLIGFMSPRVLVGAGVPLDQWATDFGVRLGLSRPLLDEWGLTAVGVCFAVALSAVELWWEPAGRFWRWTKNRFGKGEQEDWLTDDDIRSDNESQLEIAPIGGAHLIPGHHGSGRKYLCQIGVKNLSNRSVKDTNVKIVMCEGDSSFHAPQTLRTKHIAIHPSDTQNWRVATCWHAVLGESLSTEIDVLQHGVKFATSDPNLKLTIQAFGENTRSEPKEFYLGIDEHHRPLFEVWDASRHSLDRRTKLLPPPTSDDLMGAYDAISAFVYPYSDPGSPDSEALSRAVDTFVKAAFDEEIKVWGIEDGTPDCVQIDKWFWRSAEMDVLSCLRGDSGVFEIQADPHSTEPHSVRTYRQCVVDVREMERKWPKKDT